MTVLRYFDALAGAGKTFALVREADRLARLGHKVLFVQPTRYLIDRTIDEEVAPLTPSYPVRAIHGGTNPDKVVAETVRHFQAAEQGIGEVLFVTHTAFLRLPYVERRDRWHVLIDEVPTVDVYESLALPDTHDLLTPYLDLVPGGPAYGLLVTREGAR